MAYSTSHLQGVAGAVARDRDARLRPGGNARVAVPREPAYRTAAVPLRIPPPAAAPTTSAIGRLPSDRRVLIQRNLVSILPSRQRISVAGSRLSMFVRLRLERLPWKASLKPPVRSVRKPKYPTIAVKKGPLRGIPRHPTMSLTEEN